MLPVGTYELLVHKGRPDSARIPIVVTDGSEDTVVLGSPMQVHSPFTYGMTLNERSPPKFQCSQSMMLLTS